MSCQITLCLHAALPIHVYIWHSDQQTMKQTVVVRCWLINKQTNDVKMCRIVVVNGEITTSRGLFFCVLCSVLRWSVASIGIYFGEGWDKILYTYIHTKIYNAQHSQACSSNQRRGQSLGGGC